MPLSGLRGKAAWSSCPPWQRSSAAPAPSKRAWRLWAPRHSQEEAGPLGAQPVPRMLELAASKAADFTAFDPSGKGIKIMKVAISRALAASEAASEAAPKG